MAFRKNLGKSFVLLIVIIVLVLGGLLWFDFLGIINVKSVFTPVYKLMGKEPQSTITSTQSHPLVADLDEDRLNKQKEAINLQIEELEKREADIVTSEEKNAEIAAELQRIQREIR